MQLDKTHIKNMLFTLPSIPIAEFPVLQVEFKMYYEPYIIMERAKVVKYDNSFVGRYFDKSTQLMELYAQG